MGFGRLPKGYTTEGYKGGLSGSEDWKNAAQSTADSAKKGISTSYAPQAESMKAWKEGAAQPRQDSYATSTPRGGDFSAYSPSSAPSPYSQVTASYGSPMGGSTSQPNFAQRDAFIQNINNQMTPYMTGQASGPPKFDFDQAWSQAGDMVNNGWQNPFTAVSQQSFPSQYQPAPTQPPASPPASPSQTADTWSARLTPELKAKLQGPLVGPPAGPSQTTGTWGVRPAPEREAELQGRRASPPAPNMVERRQAMINQGQPPAAPQQSGGIVNNRGREPSDEQKAARYWASQKIAPGMQKLSAKTEDQLRLEQQIADARARGVNVQTNSYGDVVGSHADRARSRPARGMGTGRTKVWT